jgi:DNA-binding CsgD family transcriptional regulator
VGHLPGATVVSSPHVRTTARGLWECPACGQRWHSEIEGEAQDVAEAQQSNPVFVCSCGSTLHLSEWIFHDSAAGESAERPGQGQNVHLTRTERLVLEQLVEGKSNAEIARQLSRSEGTVRNVVSRLYDKLGVDNRVQAIQASLNMGLVRPVTGSGDKRHYLTP